MINKAFRRPTTPSKMFSDMFDDLFDHSLFDAFRPETIPIDISETDKQFIVTANLPGVSKDDVDVSINDGILTIRAAINRASETNKGTFHRRERFQGTFSRQMQLPKVDEASIDAKIENGVLAITMNKSVKEEQRKRIEIK